MANQEMNEKILNKKFKKTIFSGYETEDVDSFFDEVIEYLKQNDKIITDLNKTLVSLKEENEQLKNQNVKLVQQTATYKKMADELQKEGYGNILENRFKHEKKEENNNGK